MKLLANENIPLSSSQYLAEKGYDIVHIGIIDPSITDEEVMKLAIEQKRVIITFDRDYSILVFKDGYRPPGVIYLRLQEYVPAYPGEFIHHLIDSGEYEFEGQFTVAKENNIRQRKIK
jgi:predicted nuclease of predicted toxin-antitoxin system